LTSIPAGFVTQINGAPIAEGWTRLFQINFFWGYILAGGLYFTISKIFPPVGLGIAETMDDGIIEGVARSDDSSSMVEVVQGKEPATVTVVPEKSEV
jgi:hypothetical protein